MPTYPKDLASRNPTTPADHPANMGPGNLSYAARLIAHRYRVAPPMARLVAELVYAVEASGR
jgi:hypothetical protein